MATIANDTLSQASRADLPALLAIQEQTGAILWSEHSFLEAIEAAQVFVDKKDGKVVAFIVISQLFDEAELLNIAVARDFQRQGIAMHLFLNQARKLKQNAVKCCFLEVAKRNHKAIALYEKLGFLTIGLRKNYYQTPELDDAIIMRVDL